MTEYERKAEKYFNNLACDLPEMEEIQEGVIGSGSFCGQEWEISCDGYGYILEINEHTIAADLDVEKVKQTLDLLRGYEEGVRE